MKANEIADRLGDVAAADHDLDGAVAALVGVNQNYTHSLDAAATLVPAGYDWAVGGGCLAGEADVSNGDAHWSATAATPALALCAAALKAIAARDAALRAGAS